MIKLLSILIGSTFILEGCKASISVKTVAGAAKSACNGLENPTCNKIAPAIDTISDQTINENVAIAEINGADSGDDLDSANTAITYTCYYDTTKDDAVSDSTLCTALAGISFDTATSVMNWTPNYSQSGTYEFKITGSNGSLTDDEVFVITVNNVNTDTVVVNAAPALDAIADLTVNENAAMTAVDAGDGADDLDVDTQAITYTCYYDSASDGVVASTSLCSALTGVSFATGTGIMTWTPSYSQSGTYEFKITGSDTALSDDEFFVVTVTNVNQSPTLSITNPTGNDDSVAAGTSFSVAFTAADADDAATVSLYRNTSTTNCADGSLTGWTSMTTSLTEGTDTTYSMSTTGLGGTTQYICGRISDGTNTSVYALSGSLTVTAASGPSTVTTSTSVAAMSSEPQRKTFYDTINSRHWAFVYNGSAIAYSYSTDSVTWTAVSTIAYNTPNFHVAFRTVGGVGYAFLVVEAITYDIELRRGTLSTTSIAFDAAVTVYDGASTSDRYYNPTLGFNASHYVWVAASQYNGSGYQLRAKDSVNIANGNLSSWNGASQIGKRSVTGTKNAVIMPRTGSDMYIVANDAGAVIGYKYTAASWSEAMTGSNVSEWFKILGESHSINGTVSAVAVSGGNIYIGGAFSNVGGNTAADCIAFWNGTSWNAMGAEFDNSTDTVMSIAVSGSNIYVGGTFTDLGGNTSADNIAYWDGAGWNAVGAGISDTVNAIAVSGGNVYAGGFFTDAGGNTSADYIAYWNGTAWTAFGAGLNSSVYSIAISGSNVFAGGSFTDAGTNTSADRIAYWSGAAWIALGSGISNGNVNAIAISGSNIYAGGSFTDAGGNTSADKIGYWDGTAWTALNTGLDSTVGVIAISGSNIYVGGDFTNAGGNTSADKIAYWDGTTWTAMGTGTSDVVSAIAITGSNIYVGGAFTSAGGNTSANHIAYWSGASWNAFATRVNADINAIAVSGSNIYVGGGFTNLGGNASADYIAYWDGNIWSALGTGLDGPVKAITISGSNIFAGGDFTDAGGNTSADYIAYWDGTSWNAVGAGIAMSVNAIAVSGSNIYAGGDFTNAGGNAFANFISYWDGANWIALGSGLGASVMDIEISGTNVYAGGQFEDAGGNTSADYIAFWDGTNWNALGVGLNLNVDDIAISGANIYVSGSFYDAGGNNDADNIAFWNGTTWNAMGTGLSGSGINDIKVSGSNIYVVGNFTDVDSNVAIDKVAYWDGTNWNPVGTGIYEDGIALAISGTNIYTGGNYQEIHHYTSAISNTVDTFSSVSDASGNIHLLTHSSSGIDYKSWNGTTWSAASSVSTEGFFPILSYHSLANDLYAFFTEAGALKYKSFDMTTWSAATTVQATGVSTPSCDSASGGGIIKCLWLESGSASPYNIKAGTVTP